MSRSFNKRLQVAYDIAAFAAWAAGDDASILPHLERRRAYLS